MEPLNGFQANVAPSEAAGPPAACLVKRLACAGVGRAAKRCAGMGAGCGGKYHVDGVYIILRRAGDRAWSHLGLRRPPRRRLPDPWRVPHERVARCVCLGVGCGGKCHVDGVYIVLSVHKVAASCLLR